MSRRKPLNCWRGSMNFLKRNSGKYTAKKQNMKRTVLLIFIAACSTNVFSQASRQTESKVVSVTVFRNISQKVISTKPSLQDWQNIVEFFNKNLAPIYDGLRREKSRRKELENESKAIERTISQIRFDRRAAINESKQLFFARTPETPRFRLLTSSMARRGIPFMMQTEGLFPRRCQLSN